MPAPITNAAGLLDELIGKSPVSNIKYQISNFKFQRRDLAHRTGTQKGNTAKVTRASAVILSAAKNLVAALRFLAAKGAARNDKK
jgi:hypothetical protein